MPSWRIDFNKQWLPGIAAAPHGLQWPSHKSQPGWLEASSLPTSRSRWSRGVPAHLLLEEEQLKKRKRVEAEAECPEECAEGASNAGDLDSAGEAEEAVEDEELEDEEVGEEEEEGDEEYSAGEEEEEETGEESERDSDNEGGSDDPPSPISWTWQLAAAA